MNGIRSGAVVVMLAAGLCARAQVGVGPPPEDPMEKEKRAQAALEPARPDAIDSKERIEPELLQRLDQLAKGELIEIGVWVRQDYDPGVQMLARLDAQAKRQDEAALIGQSRQLTAQTLAPVVALARGLGAVVVYQSAEAPLIFLRIDAPGVLALAANGGVDRIYPPIGSGACRRRRRGST
jgi:hypothetical protein